MTQIFDVEWGRWSRLTEGKGWGSPREVGCLGAKEGSRPWEFSRGGNSIRTSQLGAREVKQPTLGDMRGAVSNSGAFRGGTLVQICSTQLPMVLGWPGLCRNLGDSSNL